MIVLTAAGVYKGREMKAQGLGATAIAKTLGIGRASVTGCWKRIQSESRGIASRSGETARTRSGRSPKHDHIFRIDALTPFVKEWRRSVGRKAILLTGGSCS